jgi:outer membrane protein W
MKRVIMLTGLILMLVASVAVAASGSSKGPALSYWVGASYNKMLETGAMNGSFGALAGLNYMVSPDIAVGVMSGYLIIGKEDTTETIGGTEYKWSDKLTAIPVTGQVTYFFKGKSFHPYVGAGAGIYMLKSKFSVSPAVTGFADSDTSFSKFGFNAGLGFAMGSGSMKYGVDAKVHFISDTATKDDGTAKMGKLGTLAVFVLF